jgi:hypothetical protein
MIGGIVITKSGPTPGILAKQRGRIQKACFYKIGVHWHRHYRPKHFTREASSIYGGVYKPRRGESGNEHPRGFRRSYTGRKLRRFGHTNPLVFTGESRRLAKIQDVRATSKGNRVVYHARKLNFKNRHSQINMREEATVVRESEATKLIEVFDDTFQQGVNVIRTRETTVI